MQSFDSLHTFRPKLVASTAANQDYLQPKLPVAAATPSNSVLANSVLGWDPHEVWRRMIKEPRERRVTQGA